MSSLAVWPAWASASSTVIWVSEAIATCVVAAIVIITTLATPPAALSFIERDPTMSFQLTRPETVPFAMLLSVCVCVPVAILLLGHIIAAITTRCAASAPPSPSPLPYTRPTSCRLAVTSLAWLLLAFGQTLLLTFAVTNGLKIAVGRQRPNFFALCDYAGYRAALSSKNFTQYFDATTPGVFGSLDRCLAPERDVWEGMKSFPSGHSSMAFASMLFAVLYLRATFAVPNGTHYSVGSLLSGWPLIIACFIAVSRIRDRWHNPDDVVIGSLIGIGCATVTWWHYRANRKVGLAPTSGVATFGDEEASPISNSYHAVASPMV